MSVSVCVAVNLRTSLVRGSVVSRGIAGNRLDRLRITRALESDLTSGVLGRAIAKLLIGKHMLIRRSILRTACDLFGKPDWYHVSPTLIVRSVDIR